jgi:hypothetical protein
MSDEEKEIFKNLKEYMQNNINNGYHKFIYNDLGWDFKCIDCINAIDKVLKQSKEIELLKEENEKYKNPPFFDEDKYTENDKIKAIIEELQKDIQYSANPLSIDNSKFGIKVLQSLLEKE